MAGRCGCSSSNATGASISAGSCTTVTGAGTTASPAVIGVLVDPDAANNLQCGAGGLFSATAQVEAGDDSIVVTGDGSNATPYEIAAQISSNARNLLTLDTTGGEEGLLATADPEFGQSTGAYLGGSAPLTGLIAYTGQTVVTTDGSGLATINLPTAFPTGFITAIISAGDLPGSSGLELAVNASTVTLGSFGIRARDGGGTPIAVGNIRVNWIVFGW
jgi:hypothetical protein